MNQTELGLYIHQIEFENRCYRERGAAFQTLFESIMRRADPSFIAVKPHGKEGDWKNDGFSKRDGIVYQCYSPDTSKIAEILKKVTEDFSGAKKKWGPEMKQWVFVWGHEEALPAPVLNLLLNLGRQNPSIKIDNLSREALWKIVSGLPELDRVSLLGVVPQFSDIIDTTAVEVQPLLNYLVRENIPMQSDDISLTEISEKITRNNLSENVRVLIRNALPVAHVVENYVKKNPDPLFSATVANSLVDKYKSLVLPNGRDADHIFWELVKYVKHDAQDPKEFWSAVGIVTFYFELCDVFER
jgi:hypothetical protein